ncbi:MAG: MCE family protein [Rhodospirillales bacterium]|nr:MCE family protein [Rhodospirillales bacterium]
MLIGAFVLLGAAALMLFTLWIAGTPLNRDYSTYDVVFEGPVNGLIEGGEVRFNGIKVGEVQRLSLDRQDPNRVIARIRVDAGYAGAHGQCGRAQLPRHNRGYIHPDSSRVA